MPVTDSKAAGVEFVISRTFKASRDTVWKAWTDPKLMAQWFGPKGVTTTVLQFDIRTGGIAHSRMESPGGNPMWVKFVYREVTPPSRLVWVHSFADEKANVIRGPFDANWPLEILAVAQFESEGTGTRITLTWVPLNATETERALFEATIPSMTMGWTGSLDQLDALLASNQS